MIYSISVCMHVCLGGSVVNVKAVYKFIEAFCLFYSLCVLLIHQYVHPFLISTGHS